MVPNKILVTGATGFVGKAFADYLDKLSFEVVRAVRKKDDCNASSCFAIGDINGFTHWSKALNGVSTVVHCAARVHVMNESAKDSYVAFYEVNVAGTLNLARQAHDAGVKRFVYLSSVKVNGEKTVFLPFSETDTPLPEDDYGRSKYEAEQKLFTMAATCGLEVVIVRPPLIYGPNVKANFLKLLGLVNKRMPLPFGSLKNKRSLLYLDNLLDFLKICIDHSAAAGEIFLVSDGEDLSMVDLLKRLGLTLNKPVILVPVYLWILSLALRVIGKGDMSYRLCNSLQVNIDKAKGLLGWSPPVKVNDALAQTARAYLGNRS